MKTNFIVIFYQEDGEDMLIKHLVGFEEEPADDAILHLIYELDTDPEFGMVGDHDYAIKIVPMEGNEELFRTLGIPDEFEAE